MQTTNNNSPMQFTFNPQQMVQMVVDWMAAGSFIPVNKHVARKYGVNIAYLLSETINQYKRWAAKGELTKEGWFFWTVKDCQMETALTKSTQNRTFEKMSEHGFLTTRNEYKTEEGIKKTRYIELHFDKIFQVMFDDPEEAKMKIRMKQEDTAKKQKVYKKRYLKGLSNKKKTDKQQDVDVTEEFSEELVPQHEEVQEKNEEAETLDMTEESGVGSKWNYRVGSKWNYRVGSKSDISNKELITKKESLNKKELKDLSILFKSIKELDVPEMIKDVLSKDKYKNKIEGLIDSDKLDLQDIELLFKSFEIKEQQFADILDDVLKNKHSDSNNIKTSFKAYLRRSIETRLHEPIQAPKNAYTRNMKSTRTEMLPDWFEKQQRKEEIERNYGHLNFNQPNSLVDEDEIDFPEEGTKEYEEKMAKLEAMMATYQE